MARRRKTPLPAQTTEPSGPADSTSPTNKGKKKFIPLDSFLASTQNGLKIEQRSQLSVDPRMENQISASMPNLKHDSLTCCQYAQVLKTNQVSGLQPFKKSIAPFYPGYSSSRGASPVLNSRCPHSLGMPPASSITCPTTIAGAVSSHTKDKTPTVVGDNKASPSKACPCKDAGKKLLPKPLEMNVVPVRPEAVETMLYSPQTVTGTIGILPPEIQDMVFQNLSWDGAIHLAATNKYYRSFIIPENYGDKKERTAFLRSQEEKRKFNNHRLAKTWFACTGCWRLKIAKRFNLVQVRGRAYGKGGRAWIHRRCLDCWVKENDRVSTGMIWNGAEKTMRFCKACKMYRSGLHCEHCGVCKDCAGGDDGTCPRCMGYFGF